MVSQGSGEYSRRQQVTARMHSPAEPPGRSRPAMSTDRITAAALQIVDTEGSRALTMRVSGKPSTGK